MSLVDGGDGSGWCRICNEGQDGYPCLHDADDVVRRIQELESLLRSRPQALPSADVLARTHGVRIDRMGRMSFVDWPTRYRGAPYVWVWDCVTQQTEVSSEENLEAELEVRRYVRQDVRGPMMDLTIYVEAFE